MRKALRRLKKCQLVASMPPERESGGPVAGCLLGSVRLGPHRRLEGRRRDHHVRKKSLRLEERSVRDVARDAQCAQAASGLPHLFDGVPFT